MKPKSAIAQLRKREKLTQKKVAEFIGATRQRYQEIENGLTHATEEELKKLMEILKATLEELLATQEESEVEP